jgi:rhamnose transport system ATP-binding protein
MTDSALLRCFDLRKSYAGVQALSGANFELRRGEIHALIGENGAGKSTLVKIITGALDSDSGWIELDGQPIADNSPRRARSLGVSAIYQQPALFAELSVAENIALGQEPGGRSWRINWGARRRRAAELLAQVGARIDPDVEAGDLTMPQQQLVEIARALATDAKLMILDEPTASLSEEDTQNLFRLLRRLRSQGVGMIYISHRLEELPIIADRVTILRDGRSIETLEISEVNRQELIRLMVGRELSAVFPVRAGKPGRVVLELLELGCSETEVKRVNLQVRAGEIVGVAGLVGAGRTALARVLFGLTPADEGEVRIEGRPVVLDSPSAAIAHAIAYLPEDRRRHGVIPEMSIASNISLASIDRLSRFGKLDLRRERQIAADFAERFSIKAPAIFSPVAILSGGNQQKVALSRWLSIEPSILILDEPTQGIDIGAKAEIHSLICKLADEGAAVMMISSDLPEILGMSDRIAVMREGTIVAVVDREEATSELILGLALGHS